MAQHSLQRIAALHGAGVELLSQRRGAEYVAVCVLHLTSVVVAVGGRGGGGEGGGKRSAVVLDVSERAEVEADDLGDAPWPEGEEVVLVAPKLGADAEALAGNKPVSSVCGCVGREVAVKEIDTRSWAVRLLCGTAL